MRVNVFVRQGGRIAAEDLVPVPCSSLVFVAVGDLDAPIVSAAADPRPVDSHRSNRRARIIVAGEVSLA
ncbi:hypothetical protein BOX37_10820 [Nocardia mangyaensis]|uniref:Uncharacterized protein n=1 Tax=Nocardia mangyaensis TaxID=2213200 RepID=A0A1J0VQS3_9NOCA|nr:hypothetical protein BOX37_10820 [Nocardia mangyaensis]